MTRPMKDSGIAWIGQIPKQWNILPLRYWLLTRQSGAWGEDERGDERDCFCIRVADFEYNTFGLRQGAPSTLRSFPQLLIRKLMLAEQDILIEKSGGGEKTPVGRTIIIRKKFKTPTLFANFIDRLRTKPKLCALYLQYFLVTFYKQGLSPLYFQQTIGIQNLNIAKMFRLEKSPTPPLLEQQRIADYLDKKCAEIEELSQNIQKQIDTLEQYKRAVITETVTKGLNPSAPMKDSGIPWIGKVPVHWSKCKIKNACSLIGSGTTPDSAVSSFYEDGTVNWIQSGDVYGKLLITDVTTLISEHALRTTPALKIYKAPFIVIAMYGGSVGNTAISLIDACTNQACCCLKPNNDTDLKFLFYWINFCKPDFLFRAEGGGQPNISQTKIKNQVFYVPPKPEQQAIADYLDDKCGKIDAIIHDKQQQLEKLEEYKKALIFEYVTGKKEVPEA